MIFFGLGACLALSAFLLVSLLTSLLVWLVWRQAERDVDLVGSRPRAAGLFLLRILPTAAGAVLALGVFAPAFYQFEPRETGEIIGVSLGAMACAAVALILVGVLRGGAAACATRRLVRQWLRDARPIALPDLPLRTFSIDAQYPIVSVVGILRPRFFISNQVLGACTPEELSAIARHECGHVAYSDNLKRLALRVCVDPLSWLPVGRRMEQQWQAAAEEAADEYSVAGEADTSALALAHALVRVARLVPQAGQAALKAAFFYAGGNVERRVRRLLDSSPRPSRAPWIVATRVLALVPLAVAVAALVSPNVLRAFHAVLEAVVETLP